MLAYKITDEVRVKATKDQPKTITIIEGDPLYYRSKKGAKAVEIQEPYVFNHSILLFSDGTTRVRITVPKPKPEKPKKTTKKTSKKSTKKSTQKASSGNRRKSK